MTSIDEIFSVNNAFRGLIPRFFRFCADVSVCSLLYYLEIKSNGLLFILTQRFG